MTRTQRVRAWVGRHRVSLAVLVPVVLAFLWVASDEARAGWWRVENHLPVQPGPLGWAVIEDTGLSLESFERLRVLQEDDESFHPPAGYAVWRAVVASRSDYPDTRYCDVGVVDDRGRTFTAPLIGVPGYSDSTVGCGARPDPEDLGEDPPAEGEPFPRPGSIVTEVLFLLPEDAEPVEVRVWTEFRDDAGFGARYAALPVP